MSSNILNIGIQALKTNQSAISVIGHNIANVNTPGYSRQSINLSSIDTNSGVKINSINRIADQYLNNRILHDNATLSKYTTLESNLSNLTNVIGDNNVNGISLNSLYDAINNMTTDPTNIGMRESFINELNQLSNTINTNGTYLQEQLNKSNESIKQDIHSVNAIASTVAKLNQSILKAESSGQTPNDLIDKRDNALEQLSSFIDFNVTHKHNSSVKNVFIGQGQPLVIENSHGTMTYQHNTIQLNVNNSKIPINDQISAGSIGANLSLMHDYYPNIIHQMDLLSTTLSSMFNQQHQQGVDLNNMQGGNLFKNLELNTQNKISSNSTTHFNASVNITDLNQAKPTQYHLQMNDNGFTIKRSMDGSHVQHHDLSALSNSTLSDHSYYLSEDKKELFVQIDGIRFNISSSQPLNNQSFTIEPYKHASLDFSTEIQSAESIALSSTDLPGVSNNVNGFLLLATKDMKSFNNQSISDNYKTMVNTIGIDLNNASLNKSSSDSVLNASIQQRDSISGVNLDEEAANLIKFQQAYLASTQLIKASQTLFDSLIRAI